jgi:transposase-like protein
MPSDPKRCPYCVQGNHFRVMIEVGSGSRFKCGHCGHIAIPEKSTLQMLVRQMR